MMRTPLLAPLSATFVHLRHQPSQSFVLVTCRLLLRNPPKATSALYANLGLGDFTPQQVTRVGELLALRQLCIRGEPHQVLLERKIDSFCHQDAGDAIASVAARFPPSDASADSDLDDSR
jgi:hypothetical protein